MLEHVATAERPRLLGIAYRMTGSYSDAEDIVQETMLRIHRAAPTDIDSPAAYLTTVTTRLAIDHLRSARVRRESYVGPWLPEPIAADPAPDAASRAVLTRHDLHRVPRSCSRRSAPTSAPSSCCTTCSPTPTARSPRCSNAAKDPAACSSTERANDCTKAAPASMTSTRRNITKSCDGSSPPATAATSTPSSKLSSPMSSSSSTAAPTCRTAARHPIRGADRVARFLAYVMTPALSSSRHVETTTLNGGPAVLVHAEPGGLIGAVFIEPSDDDRAAVIRWVRNPTKLRQLQ